VVSLYVNNCELGKPTGDGSVGKHELNALSTLGEVIVLDAGVLRKYNPTNDPFLQDYFCSEFIKKIKDIELAHFYGGPYNLAVQQLKQRGIKTIVTMQAHDRALTMQEHDKWFGAGSYPFMHVKDDGLWEIYTAHLRTCDRVIAASTHSKENMIRDMHVPENKITTILHGCEIPAAVVPLPDRFTVGYMSQVGPDKGLIYLIQAWSELGYKDSELILAGDGTDSPFVESLIKQLAPNGRFRLLGRVVNPSDVYNACSVMVQPSVTEGMGITIVESLAHGRPVITTRNCCGGDVIVHTYNGSIVPVRDAGLIANSIRIFREMPRCGLGAMSQNSRASSLRYSWTVVEREYVKLYNEVLGK